MHHANPKSRQPFARWLTTVAVIAVIALPLAGCLDNPNAVTGANAQGFAGSGKAYVILDSYESLEGMSAIMSNKAHNGVQFINTGATYNLLYARTPVSMKLGTLPPNAGGISAVEPGTYRLISMELAGHPCFFGMGDSPVEFTVTQGEVVYLGALEYHYTSTHNPVNIFAPPSYEISFGVVDELASHMDEVAKNLALLPGHSALKTRLMTIRKPDVAVAGRNKWGGPRFSPSNAAPETPAAPPPGGVPHGLPPAPSPDDQI